LKKQKLIKKTQTLKLNNTLNIFNKNINNNSKIVPFNTVINSVGENKYFPAVSKEWTNSVYYYNNNNIKNLPAYDININKLILAYFNMYFKYDFIKKRKRVMSYRSRRLSLKKIHISKSEIKHTNNKAILTIYTFNKEKLSLVKKVKKLRIKFFKKILFLFYLNLSKFQNKSMIGYNLSNKILKLFLRQELELIRSYKLRLSLNNSKFQDQLLLKLGNVLKKIYNKNVEFNIINLKSMVFNSDLFTKILGLRIKNRKANLLRMMYYLLNKVSLPTVNTVKERSRVIKSVNNNLPENKYKTGNLNIILNNSNLDKLLQNMYPSVHYNNERNLYENNNEIVTNIFENIKYKNMAGMRLEIKGRLSKRYRADRALFKLKWKGGLKNIDSSFKGLSTVNYRGFKNTNVQYSMFVTKRRIGAYAVKGWISGK
jgi:hypothetical protein